MPDFPKQSVALGIREEAAYSRRGNYHYLEYYDGPLLTAQMCVASADSKVIEVTLDNRMADTDGYAVYTRFNREDLQRMLRILDEEPVDKPEACGDSPGSIHEHGCLACMGPGPHENRDE